MEKARFATIALVLALGIPRPPRTPISVWA